MIGGGNMGFPASQTSSLSCCVVRGRPNLLFPKWYLKNKSLLFSPHSALASYQIGHKHHSQNSYIVENKGSEDQVHKNHLSVV